MYVRDLKRMLAKFPDGTRVRILDKNTPLLRHDIRAFLASAWPREDGNGLQLEPRKAPKETILLLTTPAE